MKIKCTQSCGLTELEASPYAKGLLRCSNCKEPLAWIHEFKTECPPGVHSLFDPCPGNCTEEDD